MLLLMNAKERMNEWKKLNDILFNLLGDFCDKDPEIVKNDASRDLWLSAEDSLNYGIIDEIVSKK